MSTQARLDELKITLSEHHVVSPVDGFVGRRNLDPGAFAGANTPVLSVVDIGTRPAHRQPGRERFQPRDARARRPMVEVDAFPGETVHRPGQPRVARVRPGDAHRDDGNRSAESGLPPEARHVCARAADGRSSAERADRAARRGRRHRRQARRVSWSTTTSRVSSDRADRAVTDGEQVEILEGLNDGQRVITTGALALRDGDRVHVAGGAAGTRRRGARRSRHGGPPARSAGEVRRRVAAAARQSQCVAAAPR